jgi:hypothetical protein
MAVTGKKTFKLTAVGDKLDGKYKVKRISWISETSTDGDNLVITDVDEDIVFEGVCDATTYEDTLYLDDEWVDTLTVTTMDSGYIIVVTC